MNIEMIEDLYICICFIYLGLLICGCECAGNNHGKMENQDYTFVLTEIAKVRSNEEILTSLSSILLCVCNMNECLRLDSFCEN